MEPLLLTLRPLHAAQSVELPLDPDYSLGDLETEINGAIDTGVEVKLLLDPAYARRHNLDAVKVIRPWEYEVISVTHGDLKRARPCH